MVKPVLNQFNGGEISPWLEGRIDLPKYNYSAAKMLNFIPQVEGGVKRRGGSHFVAPVKEVDAVLFKIVPTPSEAIVYINNEIADELYVAPGEKVSYSVKLDGYFPVSGTYVVEEDTTLNISLVSTLYRATLTVKTIPEDADVFINSLRQNPAVVTRGATAAYEVMKDGFDTKTDSIQVNADTEITVKLAMSFEIRTAETGAKIVINGIEQSKIEVQKGDLVTWSVSKPGYKTQSGSQTIERSTILYIDLDESGYALNEVIFEKSKPGTYKLKVKISGYYHLSACGAGGGAGGSAGAHAWYGGNGGSGAAFAGKVWLEAGEYTIKVGEGGRGGWASGRNATRGEWWGYSSALEVNGLTYLAFKGKSLIDLWGGRGGHGTGTYAEGGGDGGKLEVGMLKIISSTVKSAGKKESTTSLLQNGFGAGGKAGDLGENGAGGTNGYVKIVYLGQA